MGPESRKHCWGQRRPHRRVVQSSWVTERGGGGEVVVKPNTAGGSVSPSKSDPESVYYYLAVQYSWSIYPTRDQEPGPTRVVGRPKGSYMGVFFT